MFQQEMMTAKTRMVRWVQINIDGVRAILRSRSLRFVMNWTLCISAVEVLQ